MLCEFGLAEVEECIGGGEQEQHGEDGQVAPVAPGHDLARGDGGEAGEKGDVDRRGRRRADPCRERDGDPPGEPDGDEGGERKSLERQTAGPVRDRGQEKPADRRGDEAEQHFVDMPGDGIERGRQFEGSGQHRQPQHQRDGRPERGEQEERPEALVEERRAGLFAVAGYGRVLHAGHALAPGRSVDGAGRYAGGR